jgi:hypothetical protein
MKKLLFTFSFAILASIAYSQVGIGTNTPDNSSMLEVQSTTKGILFPRMTSVQRTSIASPANGLYVFDTNTSSLWFYNGSAWINTASESTYGDVKSGFQTADHSGWIKLDGRAIATLSASQQAVASSLGFTSNLPDATTAYLVQDNGTIGGVTGSNTRTIAQANLPNVNFTGTAASAGGHNHGGATGNAGGHNHTGTTSDNGQHSHSGSTSVNGSHSHSASVSGSGWNAGGAFVGGFEAGTFVLQVQNVTIASSGDHSHTLSIDNSGNHNHTFTTSSVGDHNHSINTDGAHTHSVAVSSGGSGTAINIAPKSLTVNMFVYLGL